ncbi:hypothetical protein ABGB19_01675 [Mycobacterium sp. B14F4]|uniref:hypothetical protein n=1 Tax=Mycobacterium sp. B14F4 TaxID=3153565 RepID=UPI00325C4CE7
MALRAVVLRQCPFCKHAVNAFVDRRNPENTPHDGDISVCARCSGLSVFDGTELRLPTPAELANAVRDRELMRAIRELRAERDEWMVF